MIVRWAAALGFLVAASPALAEDKKMSDAEKKAEAAIRDALNSTGKAIDSCTERYLKEQPKAEGTARVSVTVSKEGRTKDAQVQTSLPQARTLRLCLEAVARGWTFPKPRKPTPIGLTVPVAPGVKFRVPAPGEKPPAKAAPKKQKEGFLRLSPGSFLPSFTGQSSE